MLSREHRWPLPWKTGHQFDQSPIIAISQIFMEEQRKPEKRKKTTET